MNENTEDKALDWKPVRLLTIVAERVLKDRLLAQLELAGVSGYTVIEGAGRGARHLVIDEWQGDNVEIQVIARRDVLDAIARSLRDQYFAHHSLILYAQDVDVLRPDKYGA